MNLIIKQQQSFFESLLENCLPCWVRDCWLVKPEIFRLVDKNLVESDIVYFIELKIAALLSQKLFPCWIRNCCLVESDIVCFNESENIYLFESKILAILSLKLLPSWVRDCYLVEGRNFSEPLFCRTLMNRIWNLKFLWQLLIDPFLLFYLFYCFLFKGAKWFERVTESKLRHM